MGVTSLLPLCMSHGFNSGPQAWQQVSLHTEPFACPDLCLYLFVGCVSVCVCHGCLCGTHRATSENWFFPSTTQVLRHVSNLHLLSHLLSQLSDNTQVQGQWEADTRACRKDGDMGGKPWCAFFVCSFVFVFVLDPFLSFVAAHRKRWRSQMLRHQIVCTATLFSGGVKFAS